MKRLLIIATALLAGCTTTRYVPVELTRDLYHHTTTTDSVFIRDSVVIDRAGDTIRETRWRDRWRTRTVHDTVATHDAIPAPYPVEVPVEVPAKLTAWQHIKVEWGGWALGICAALLGLMAWRLKQ